MAHCIARRAARRARMIMAMRATCKRVAAPGARGYEMPLKRHFRDSSNFWPTAGLFLHAERRSATKTPVRASSVRAEARRLVGRSFGYADTIKRAQRAAGSSERYAHILLLLR